jgi:hypothetical protein
LIYQAAATSAEPATSPDDGGSLAPESVAAESLPADPTTVDIEQLMDLPVRAAPRQDPAEALKGREAQAAGNDAPRDDELPADITTMSLDSLMNLRVRTVQQDEENKKDKKDDKDPSDPENNGEDAGEAQQIAADDPAAPAAGEGQNGEGEAAQGEGDGTGDGDGTGNGDGTGDGTGNGGGEGGSEGGAPAPPQSSGSDGGESSAASLGQAIQVLPTELVYAAALRSGDPVHSAPAPQPVAAAPILIQQVTASAPLPNAAPLAKGDAAATAAATAVTIPVLANDSDAEGSALHVTGVTQGGHGSVAINPDGTLTYVPDAGFSGTDTFTYTISDGNGGGGSAAVSVTVAPLVPPVNVAPVAQNDQAATGEDAAVIINVLGNDTDADGDPLFVSAVTQGQNGQVTINTDGTLTYTPQADFFGTDTFRYTISDGRGGTSTATVSVVVKPVNDAPVAADDAANTDQGQPVTFAVLANDGDPDGDPLIVTSVTSGANGKVAINADGTLTYYPATGFAGTDSFTYTVSDGQGGSAQATVSVVVNRVNAPPVATDSLAAMEAGTPINGTLTAADADHAPADLRYSLAAAPANGTAVVQADGTYTYSPATGFVGTDTFAFTVTDPTGASANASVTVSVLPGAAGTGAGGEFVVNSTTAGAQQVPVLAALKDGGFVIAWESQNQDGSGFGIFAQRFDAHGAAVGTEFRANTFVLDHQQMPSAAALEDGGFVLVWQSRNQDGIGLGVFGKRFDANGQAVGVEFQANTFTRGDQDVPDVAGLADGGFVVTWQSQNQDGNNTGIFAQRYDAAGQAVGGEFQVNTFIQNAQQAPDVAALSDGGFVIVWDSQNQDGNNAGVYGQRFAANGLKVGGEFQVNTFTQNAQQAPEVAALTGGGFVAVWESQNQDGNNSGIFGQRFAADGTRLGGEFQVNTMTAGSQQTASVTAAADGGFTVVWQSDSQDGSGFGVHGQRYDANGLAAGQEFQVNVFTAGFQGAPDVAVLADGSLAVSWQSAGQDGASEGIIARVVAGSAPAGHAFTGGAGNDSFIGGALADTLSGGAGNDRLEGALGADQLFGGSGDDILLWDPADAVIDGAAGNDTLQVNGGDVNLPGFANKIGGLEAVDLATDAAANHLTLRVQDILAISDTDVLSVLGDGQDSVDAGTGWIQAGADGQGNDIYTQTVGGVVATLIVDSDITLNADLLL